MRDSRARILRRNFILNEKGRAVELKHDEFRNVNERALAKNFLKSFT